VTLTPDLDPRLVAWVERLLAKPPSDRPRHATEAWEALEETAIDLLGPRWTREARLVDGDVTPTPPAPPTRPVGATVPAAPRGAEVGTTRAGDRGRRRWLWVGAALLVLGLAAGAVAAIVAGNGGSGGNNGRAATVSTGPPTLTQVAFSEDERSLTTRLEFDGSPLKGDSVHTLDAAIGDGAAAVGVAGRRIRTRVARENHDGLTVRLLRQPGRLRVALSGRSGAFVALAARLEPPSTVVVTLTKIARPKTGRAAADALVQAWKAGDRDAALAVADKGVVAKLFRLAFPEPAPRLQDCGSVGTGQIECAYEYEFGQRTVGFKAYEFGGIFHVLEISFT
jgi:hypothetical protein